MQSIVAINTALPTIDDEVEYFSGASLRDYDIAIFDPEIPHLDRIDFSGGGSCLTIESTQRVQSAMAHWAAEIRSALQTGKTIFVLLNEFDQDIGANGSEMKNRTQRTYNTFHLNNYQALPLSLSAKNTKGRHISVVDGAYRNLLNVLGDAASYKVILEGRAGHTIYSTKDGAPVASIVKVAALPGHLVLLPYFDLVEYDKASREEWSEKANRISQGVVAQLVAIDRALRLQSATTPAPEWINNVNLPQAITAVNAAVTAIDTDISELVKRKEEQLNERERLLAFSRLLYENGKPLESAIEDGLRLLGYSVENYRDGDLEIDHIIVGPTGVRMIGESEGKDNSAIDIGKFRQLESNINEDFERDDVGEPAKGILFANGFRLTDPSARAEQFTAKCMTNARRLGTALVRSADLYEAVIYALDHPNDEAFREACREALENTRGEIVVFPKAV